MATLSLAFELSIFQIGGTGIKFWMIAAVLSGVLLLWELYKKGFVWLKKSKIFWFGLGLIFFSLLGLLNSPIKLFSAKQLIVLGMLTVLAIFFEQNVKKYRSLIYFGLLDGILLNSFYALYQNIAFNLGWPNFEIMAARPNGFFPEPDWLGIYLALGLVPFLVWVGQDLRKSRLPERLKNKYIFYPIIFIPLTVLIITVARASWLAILAEMGIITVIFAYLAYQKSDSKFQAFSLEFFKKGAVYLILILVSLAAINIFSFSRFNIPDRFRSIFFKEHVITEAYNPTTGDKIKINLEDIESYRNQGYWIQEEYVGDENVASRQEKFVNAWDIIRAHPILGSGLGITLISTNYEHNANNLFLEWWASAGLAGLVLICGLLIYLLVKGVLLINIGPDKTRLIVSGIIGFTIVNIFNASIFLAFAWFYIAFLLSSLNEKK